MVKYENKYFVFDSTQNYDLKNIVKWIIYNHIKLNQAMDIEQ